MIACSGRSEGPALTVNKGEDGQHPSPDPDSVTRIQAIRVAMVEVRQAAPVTVGMAEEEGVFSVDVVHGALGHHFGRSFEKKAPVSPGSDACKERRISASLAYRSAASGWVTLTVA